MGLLRVEAFRLSRLGLLRAIAVLLVLAAVLRGVVWPPSPQYPPQGLWSFYPVATAVVMVTAVTVGHEFSGGTWRGLVTRGVGRWHLLAARFMILVVLGGVLLGVTEGVATALGARQALHPAELLRAWLSLWPYIALVMLLAVVARNGGLALIVGVLLLALEQFVAVGLVPVFLLSEAMTGESRLVATGGLVGALYQWSLGYNSANWTYLADFQRAPMPANAVLYALPRPAIGSGVLLVAYTLAGLGLALAVLTRRDVTDVVRDKVRWWGLGSRGRRAARTAARLPAAAVQLPSGTGRGPLMIRLLRAHVFRIGRTALVRVSAAVALLFPLTLWGAAALANKAGYGDLLWRYGAGGAPPLAFALSLLVVGPLAAVVSSLAVSSELALGTRRAERTRGVGPLHVIVAQSLALALVFGAVLVLMAGALLLIGAHLSGAWYLLSAATLVAAGLVGSGAYIAAVQVGGAVTRSPAGALLFGIGFLAADWVLLLAPTISTDSGLLGSLSPYSAGACILAAASWGRMDTIYYGWQLFGLAPALLILAAYTLLGHALAVVLAHRRDA